MPSRHEQRECASPGLTGMELGGRGVLHIVDIAQLRSAKDHFFHHDHSSPLTHEQRSSFTGLAYYADDPDYRFTLGLDTAQAGGAEEVEMSDGTSEAMPRAGRFAFTTGGKHVRLSAFFASDGSLFVPFRDATNRTESYPAGRYIEAEPTAEGMWELDFNRAYNPYCAYNSNWRCPLPPAENWLDVPIAAGEKRFHGLSDPAGVA